MTTINVLKKRLEQFQPTVDGKPALFFIDLRSDTPVSKVTWRGKPFHKKQRT